MRSLRFSPPKKRMTTDTLFKQQKLIWLKPDLQHGSQWWTIFIVSSFSIALIIQLSIAMYINLLIVLSVAISGFLFLSVCNYFKFLNENRWKQRFMHHFNATVSIVETPLTRIVPDNKMSKCNQKHMLLYINSTCSDKNKVICIVILDEVKKYIHKNICTLVFYHNVKSKITIHMTLFLSEQVLLMYNNICFWLHFDI
jgi:hypothetical protein